ncbi:hypothetical protein TWF730_004360 [Orbilia blumenaviensis]|uniref:Uncharacterized protein n=1 Tax=Orbilia blumenaviensis TaxID=1796055 RepID=A0AAV9U0D8_9PEZI
MPSDRNSIEIAIICTQSLHTFIVNAILKGAGATDADGFKTGKIEGHNVVLVPDVRETRAATVASNLKNRFGSIKFGLVIGVLSEVPDGVAENPKSGDVIIGNQIRNENGALKPEIQSFIQGLEAQQSIIEDKTREFLPYILYLLDQATTQGQVEWAWPPTIHFSGSSTTNALNNEAVQMWDCFPCISIKQLSIYTTDQPDLKGYSIPAAVACVKAILGRWNRSSEESKQGYIRNQFNNGTGSVIGMQAGEMANTGSMNFHFGEGARTQGYTNTDRRGAPLSWS